MRRRDFIALLGGAAAVASRRPPAFAQTPSKRPLIAAQIGGSKTEADRYFGGFSQGMRELGYIEGQDYGFEVRYADGNLSRIAPQLEELVRLKPDIIVSGTMTGVIAAKKLTDTIPIISETRLGSELCPAWRQCNWRVTDRGEPANQTVRDCS